ncbi:RISC-loading complex subunit tarbp2 [Orussus abietinus]|uniref:RISC-loading complex subunit tarbp2 n=1 Tax=Orussus abietinus TaxID=222816 RepID=UPI0006269C8E|nr:RISC-loading complex subunit tarbp2 [Orussus abietinus]
MSKTPIMILQEVMTKRNVLPVYDVISETSGTHVNSFTIRVKCEQLSAEGTATNKKEAKQKAAKEMLDLLDKAGKLDSSFLPSVKSDAVHSANVTSTSFVLDGNTVNHVGKLQEYCSVRKMPNPVYDVKNIIGQSHDAQFTMSCKVSKVEEEGSGRTKKIAKHNAAKKVIETLARTDSTLRFDSPKKSEKGLKRDLEDNQEASAKLMKTT